MQAPDYERTFPSSIPVPYALDQLRQWTKKHGGPISGSFELRADTDGAIRHWFGTDAVLNRFAMFGAGADGSPYTLWRQDDGRTPVVHLGSEGTNNFVLAADFVQFLRLLAVGYSEIGFENLGLPPSPEGINPAFQTWVERMFFVKVPATGSLITEPAQRTHQNLQAWIEHVLNSPTAEPL